MGNFREDILDAAGGEEIVGVVISALRGCSWYYDSTPAKTDWADRVIPWSEAEKILDYDYDDGYGSQDCHNVYVWTPTRVLGVHEYDGSTSISSVPRNPVDGEPQGF